MDKCENYARGRKEERRWVVGKKKLERVVLQCDNLKVSFASPKKKGKGANINAKEIFYLIFKKIVSHLRFGIFISRNSLLKAL